MSPTPDDPLENLDEPRKAADFIRSALTSNTAEINRTRVTSQVYLAHKTKAAGENLAAAVGALRDAASASEKYARGLNRATWALVAVTVVLALATVFQVVLLLMKKGG